MVSNGYYLTNESSYDKPEFAWQSNYHGYGVQNKRAFDNMQRYTRNNPINWLKKKSNLKQGSN